MFYLMSYLVVLPVTKDGGSNEVTCMYHSFVCIVIKFGVAVNYHLVDIVYNVNLHVYWSGSYIISNNS